ncbi:MAG: hypothetical protein HY301_12845 [Verrucomicrobia bacterium]|nr:hypothetical protein [Verrucomicrobiota bacterium]
MKLTMKFCSMIAAAGLLTLATGCYTDVGGKSHMGVPWVKDQFESRYEFSVAQVLTAVRQTLKANGTIVSDDIANNVVAAKVDTRTVYVKVDELDKKVTRVFTQARTKAGNTELTLAAEIDKQIALNLQNLPK